MGGKGEKGGGEGAVQKQSHSAPRTSYSLTLHWHQMRMASICGDIIFMPDPEGRVMPSSRATPACVAMPPRFEFLQRIDRSIEDWNASTSQRKDGA